MLGLQAGAISEGQGLSDLSVGNFFTAGWDESWVKRPHPDGAPDLTLFRVQSNLLLTSLRTDSFYERMLPGNRDQSLTSVSQLAEYSFNRRLMLAVFGNYQWTEARIGPDRGGGAYGSLVRLQMIDLPTASYAVNLRVLAPNEGLGEKETLASVAWAGWHDLTPLGLSRVGLYWHVQEETLMGPGVAGARRNDVTYALSLARTWTSPGAFLGNFSTFIETYARTDLDGLHGGRTLSSLTPGFRFNVRSHDILLFGADVPIGQPRAYDQLVRFAFIHSF